MKSDTLKAQAFIQNHSTSNAVVLGNGAVASTTSGSLVLISNGTNLAPTWQANPGNNPYSLLKKGTFSGTDMAGFGINNTSPDALLSVNATGYAANKALFINSNGSVNNHLAYRINSVSPTGKAGYVFQRDGLDQGFVGLEGNNNLVINSPKVGINNSNPSKMLDINGTLFVKGQLSNMPYNYQYGHVDLSSTANSAYAPETIDYVIIENIVGAGGNVSMPILSGTNGIYAGKRIGIFFSARSHYASVTYTITFGTNEYQLSNGTTASSISNISYGRFFTFISDGTKWYLETTR